LEENNGKEKYSITYSNESNIKRGNHIRTWNADTPDFNGHLVEKVNKFDIDKIAERYFDPSKAKNSRGNLQFVFGFACEENLDGTEETRNCFGGASVPRRCKNTDDEFVKTNFLAMMDLAAEVDIDYGNPNKWFVSYFARFYLSL
jgi:hypothetical protein